MSLLSLFLTTSFAALYGACVSELRLNATVEENVERAFVTAKIQWLIHSTRIDSPQYNQENSSLQLASLQNEITTLQVSSGTLQLTTGNTTTPLTQSNTTINDLQIRYASHSALLITMLFNGKTLSFIAPLSAVANI